MALLAPDDADLTRRTRVFCMLEGQGSLESFTYAQSQTVQCWPLFGKHANHSLLIFSAYAFLPPRAITSLGTLGFLMSIVGVLRAKLKLCS